MPPCLGLDADVASSPSLGHREENQAELGAEPRILLLTAMPSLRGRCARAARLALIYGEHFNVSSGCCTHLAA